ncbi:hypothetical protein ACIBHX_21475 [Nonomuraea sp. NPDC050536]|uniref:hypothetical protein n=1 Tax=Nonomuraea sp. NPDC050536 TaxID=3364366 RepID=UPI0037C63460
MLRLYDPRTGHVEELAAKRAMRVYSEGDLRTLLLSDVIRRVLERHRVRTVAWWADLPSYAGELNLRPPEHLDGSADFDLEVGPGRRVEAAPMPDLPDVPGLDPLAVRLALLQGHYRQPMTLTAQALGEAEAALLGWRSQVATWAESPSAPLASHVAQVLERFDDDLDTPGALRELAALAEDPAVPAGAKFESFLQVDHVLALDLSSQIGR